MRRLFALAVVVLHVLLLALLMSGVRLRVQPEREGRVFVSLWFPVVEPESPDALREEVSPPTAPRSVVPAPSRPRPSDEPAVSAGWGG